MSSIPDTILSPRRRRWVWHTGTLLAILIIGLFLGFILRQDSPEALSALAHPAQSGARLMERHLAFYENEHAIPAWQRRFFHALFGDKQEIQRQALTAYREILAYFAAHPERAQSWDLRDTRVRLAVLLMEMGDDMAAENQLQALGDMPEEEVIADTVRYAYDRPLRADVSMEEIHAGLRLFPSGWTRNKIRYLVYARADVPAAVPARQRLLAQGQRLQRDTLLLSLGLLAAGLAGVAGFLSLRRPGTTTWHAAALESAWSPMVGIQVLLLSLALGIVVFLALAILPLPEELVILRQWTTLTAGLPMLLLIHYRLLRPHGLSWVRAFGLRVSSHQLLALLLATALIMTIERAGALFLGWAGYQLGLAPHWADGISERWLWPTHDNQWLGAINLIVWAPLFEELAFRGLLYTALRRYLSPLPAAALSAGGFAALHFYSLMGFVSVLWSGLVWAWAFERFRSLLPGMLSHAIGNLLALGLILVFYR
ncbi:MAG TPA: CPBP family intramembrane metalloprotease [Gammaproteobacteria bacterium]|nr:CPBP family intramembrane metalloprotease [Gammaproteobacteria bacterium]